MEYIFIEYRHLEYEKLEIEKALNIVQSCMIELLNEIKGQF